MCEMGASDLHLSVGRPPLVRKDGQIQPLESNGTPLSDEALKTLLDPIMPEINRREFDGCHDTDFAYEIVELARFRANLFADAARSFASSRRRSSPRRSSGSRRTS
jgi:twitching motility protein PilT